MIWQNPLAWAGLLTLGVPLLIHLLGRRRARTQAFPSLRFLSASRLSPVRRTRITDVPLLLVRLAILAVAVVALAQPLWMTAARRRDVAGIVVRAIVVDTSASMQRATTGGGRVLDSARSTAQRIAREASSSLMIETAAPAHAIAGAAQWLARQSGARELVVVSDFQTGAVDSADLALVPASEALRLERIPLAPATGALEASTTVGATPVVARIGVSERGTSVEWTAGRAGAFSNNIILNIAGPSERADAAAAQTAAQAVAAWPVAGGPVAIVHLHAAERAALLRDAKPLDAPWMADVLARLRADATLAAAVADAAPSPDSTPSAPFVVVARSRDGRAVALAARGTVQARDALIVFALADAGSLASSALMAAVARALSPAAPVAEFEPSVVAEAALARWSHAGAAAPPAQTSTTDSDGRWLWMVALALLALETLMRRSSRASAVEVTA